MLELTRKNEHGVAAAVSVSLPWEKRIKSRQRVILSDGREAGIFLERGQIMRGGELLEAVTGESVRIEAALERVSTVRVEDALLMARLCYHLGNRHVSLEIVPGRLRYLHDHVLDQMVEQLGGTVQVETAPFEPEHGAYGGHGHSHGHSHG